MGLVDYIVIAVIVLIVGAASAYIIKAKKSGRKCIGCPDSCSCNAKRQDVKQGGCGGNCGCCSGCQSDVSEDQTK